MKLPSHSVRAALLAIVTTALAACGGAIESNKQQVEINLSKSGEYVAEPGTTFPVTARALARDDSLTAIAFTIEKVSGSGTTPSLINGDCKNVRLTMDGNDGNGRCDITVAVPSQGETSIWKISATATSASKGTDSRSFTLKVVAPERDTGDFRVDVPALVTTDVEGKTLLTNQLVTITAEAKSDYTIKDLAYKWTQTSGGTATLAGTTTNVLRFVPKTAGDYQFTVTATGKINGFDETASSDVLVIVGDSDSAQGLDVSAGDVQIIELAEGGVMVTLSGTATHGGTNLPSNAVFKWTQVSGPSVTLANAGSLKPTFVATEAGSYVFKLEVSATINGSAYTGTSTTQVTLNEPPAP